MKKKNEVIIRRLDPMSVAKLEGLLLAIVGLIVGIFVAITTVASGVSAGLGIGAGLGVFAIIAMPIAYGIFGFIGGGLGAVIYNFCASKVGGIKIEIER